MADLDDMMLDDIEQVGDFHTAVRQQEFPNSCGAHADCC